MSYRPFEVFAHERAFREHAGEQEREEYGEQPFEDGVGIVTMVAGYVPARQASRIDPVTALRAE